MDKRYQVFISSTFEDLQEERKEVMQALLEMDCIPAGMELFPASNEDQWSLIKRVIDDCDYYLLIIGGRYGSCNDKGVSYTQMEFEYAVTTGKPIVSFLPQYPDKIPSGKTDPENKEELESFKKLAQQKMIKYWDNPSDLGSKVSRTLIKLMKQFPSEGWVKSSSAVDEQSLKEIARLQKENNVLKEQLEKVHTVAPKGTEVYAQGEDDIVINITFNGKDNESKEYSCRYKLKLTWNEIFETFSTYLIDEYSEYKIKELIEDYISEYSNFIKNNKNFKNLKFLYSFEISDSTFKNILVQFKALGLITLSEKKKTAKSVHTFWTLTQYGDYYMTKLLAIKKGENKDEEL